MSIKQSLNITRHSALALVTLAISTLLTGCSSAPSSSEQAQFEPQSVNHTHQVTVNERQQVLSSFLQVFHRWEGAPYQFGGTSKNGIDCSAFVQIAFRDAAQTQLPRTTYYQVQVGEQLDYRNAEPGDLVFFRPSSNSRHVGVYLGNKQFMHASQSKGVIISRLDNPYWASTFWQFRRVLNP